MLLLDADRNAGRQIMEPSTSRPPPPPAVPDIVASYPTLSHVTVVRDGNVPFTVLLDVSADRAADPWQVAVWYSLGGEWTELALGRMNAARVMTPTSLQKVSGSSRRIYFTETLKVAGKCFFTVKFRNSPDADWQWVRDHQGLDDGTVIVNPADGPVDAPGSLPDLIQGLGDAWHFSSVLSQTPKTSVWTLTAPVEGANGEESTYKDIPLGLPFGGFVRWFALVRLWRPWVVPRQGRDKFAVDSPAVIASFLSPEGKHMVLLGVSGTNNVMSLFVNGPGGVVSVQARNDGPSTESATVICATGNDFGSAVAAAMYQARTMVMRCKAMERDLAKEVVALGGDFKAEWVENWYDGLGYCTWNALGPRLTDKRIFDALNKLSEKGIKISSLIIDDNWQSIDYHGNGVYQHGWLEFEAEEKSFPQGLSQTVRRIRHEHPDIQHIAVWHALLGYWGGINPEGKLAQMYKTLTVVRDEKERDHLPLGGPMTVIAKEDISKFYDDFYRFLSTCGIDAVKTDVQFMMDTWTNAVPRREMIREYLDSWSISILRHFSSRAISCMSHSPQILFYSLLPDNRPQVLFRNSGDFMPEIPDSHPWHLWTNAHNAVFSSHLNVLPDWDMFQTVHDYSAYHAAARCVSGGPIYVTDVPGEHNIELIRQMTGTSPRGKTVIFRPSVVGKTIDAYNGYHDKLLLKVGSYNGHAATGTPILGLFNISPVPVTEMIPLSSFPGVNPSASYVIRSHVTGLASSPITVSSPGSLFAHTLGVRGYDIITAYPLINLDGVAHGPVSVANLGLIGKMTGAAAIVSSHANIGGNHRVVFEMRFKALGTAGVYISTLPELTIEDDFIATILGQPIPPHTVSISKENDRILEIDLERAWQELGLHSRWANEVILKLYFSS